MRKEKKLGVCMTRKERYWRSVSFSDLHITIPTDGRIMTMLTFLCRLTCFRVKSRAGYVWNGTRPYSYDLNRWLESA